MVSVHCGNYELDKVLRFSPVITIFVFISAAIKSDDFISKASVEVNFQNVVRADVDCVA